MYEHELAQLVARLPERTALIALVPTIERDQAAALASDLAQAVGSRVGGHTLLTSFEPAPARLDHEIGAEGGPGLTDVLTGNATVPEVAAHGAARGFIYLPAGSQPAEGHRLIGSEAWHDLSTKALLRGGTVLAFVPAESWLALGGPSAPGENGAPPFDGLVWLGDAASEELTRAAATLGVKALGRLGLPGGPTPSATDVAPDAGSTGVEPGPELSDSETEAAEPKPEHVGPGPVAAEPEPSSEPTAGRPEPEQPPSARNRRGREVHKSGVRVFPTHGIVTGDYGPVERRIHSRERSQRVSMWAFIVLACALVVSLIYFTQFDPHGGRIGESARDVLRSR